MKTYKTLLLLLAVLFFSCSRKMELSYEPSLKTQACNHLSLHVLPLINDSDSVIFQENQKELSLKIGEIEYDHFSDWISRALKSELNQAGYSVWPVEQTSQYDVCHGPLVFENKSMEIEISVKENDHLIFSKLYQSNYPLEVKLYRLLFGPKTTINKVFNRSLRDICQQFIEDLSGELYQFKPPENEMKHPEFNIIGIETRTTNENDQAATDIGALWKSFLEDQVLDKIPNKEDLEIYSVYTDYEKDHTKPYTVVLGCKVAHLDEVPEGMVGRLIPGGTFTQFTAKGNLYEGAVYSEWLKIWKAPLNRKFTADYEVYGLKAQNPENAEVDIFIAVE